MVARRAAGTRPVGAGELTGVAADHRQGAGPPRSDAAHPDEAAGARDSALGVGYNSNLLSQTHPQRLAEAPAGRCDCWPTTRSAWTSPPTVSHLEHVRIPLNRAEDPRPKPLGAQLVGGMLVVGDAVRERFRHREGIAPQGFGGREVAVAATFVR